MYACASWKLSEDMEAMLSFFLIGMCTLYICACVRIQTKQNRKFE